VGLTVLRIPAEFVRDNLEAVLREIADAAARAASSLAPEAPCAALQAALPPEGEEKPRSLKGDR
jgi:hypothetical protein